MTQETKDQEEQHSILPMIIAPVIAVGVGVWLFNGPTSNPTTDAYNECRQAIATQYGALDLSSPHSDFDGETWAIRYNAEKGGQDYQVYCLMSENFTHKEVVASRR